MTGRLPHLDPRPAWFDHARCREPAWRHVFYAIMGYPERESVNPDLRERRERAEGTAKWACLACPVQPQCRAWALAELARGRDRLRGVVGGSTAKELRRELGRGPSGVDHVSTNGHAPRLDSA